MGSVPAHRKDNMVIRMSYTNVDHKIRELEKLGYLNKGDSSVKYLTSSTDFIYRFFNDNMNKDVKTHFKKKLREYLEKEKVVFKLEYSLCIIPHEILISKISEANSYTEMASHLESFNFIRILRSNGGCLNFAFMGKDGSRFRFDAKALQYALPDGITVQNDDNYNIKIISDKCTTKNEIKEIDKLF